MAAQDGGAINDCSAKTEHLELELSHTCLRRFRFVNILLFASREMNELLQKHGCANVFTVPEGLKELMADISREVLREQPKNIYEFISNYLSVLLITREHGVMAVKILEGLCDCRPSVSEHLLELGLDRNAAHTLAQIIKDQIENVETSDEKENVKESDILKKMLSSVPMDDEMAANVCQIVRNAYKDYVYKKKLMEHSLSMHGDEPWQIAAERTLALYKKSKPTLHELHAASERIQAAYRGYHVRRNLLNHLKPKKKKAGPHKYAPGPTPDIGGSREIELGPLIKIKVREDNVHAMFEDHATATLGLSYHPTNTLTYVDDAFDEGREVLKEGTTGWPHCTNIKTEIRMAQVDVGPRDGSEPMVDTDENQPLSLEREAMDVFTEQPSDRSYSLDHRAIGTPARKISFSTMPPEMIPIDDDDYPEIQEAIQEAVDDVTNDVLQEIPEDIPDNIDDKDPDYTPVSSLASLSSVDIDDQDNIDDKDDIFDVS